MKKAVISTGSKQYLVTEGDVVSIEKLSDTKKVSFQPLLVIEDGKTTVGQPLVDGVSVACEVLEADKQDEKKTSVRYKAKKRVHTVRGHRQHQTVIKIGKIA